MRAACPLHGTPAPTVAQPRLSSARRASNKRKRSARAAAHEDPADTGCQGQGSSLNQRQPVASLTALPAVLASAWSTCTGGNGAGGGSVGTPGGNGGGGSEPWHGGQHQPELARSLDEDRYKWRATLTCAARICAAVSSEPGLHAGSQAEAGLRLTLPR